MMRPRSLPEPGSRNDSRRGSDKYVKTNTIGFTKTVSGLAFEAESAAKASIRDAINKYGVNTDVFNLLQTINRSIVTVQHSGAGTQAAIFITLREVYKETERASVAGRDQIAISEALRTIAKVVQFDLSDWKWRDGGDAADSANWGHILDDTSNSYLGCTWASALEAQLMKRTFNAASDDIRVHWGAFRKEAESWPETCRLTNRR